MIVLDTNVLSALMRQDPTVLRWTGTTESGALRTTSICVAEVEYGLARMRAGRRREDLTADARRVLAAFPGFALPFEDLAAREFGRILATRERAGRPMSAMDAQIAAVCAVHGATLATRNVKDFEGTGIDLVDPWSDG